MRYWVYEDQEVPGAFEPAELVRRPGFSAASLVCPAAAPPHERRWVRAGELPDLMEAMRAHDLQPPPAPPPAPGGYVDASAAVHPDDILSASSHKIFRHVTELMKELENRREEKALLQSLQRSLVELKGELQAARERVRFLDDRASTIPALEERERRALEASERLRAENAALGGRLDEAQRRLQEAELARQNALRERDDARRQEAALRASIDENARSLAEKEASLARCLGVIRKLELELDSLTRPPSARPEAREPADAAKGAAAAGPQWPDEAPPPLPTAETWGSSGPQAVFTKKQPSERVRRTDA